MNGDEAVNTSRPVLFEHPDQELFKYYGAGSALILTWESCGYALTAKHVAEQGTPDQVRIPRDDESLAFFRFETELKPQGDEEDWKDLAFYRVHRRLESKEWNHLALPLDMIQLRAAANCYRPGIRLWVSGYPNSHSSIDYEAAHIHRGRCIMEASYESEDPSARGKHRIRIDATLETFDGLSGSPVFVEADPSTILFAGILIQGSASSRLAHVIGTLPIAAMLNQLHRAAA